MLRLRQLARPHLLAAALAASPAAAATQQPRLTIDAGAAAVSYRAATGAGVDDARVTAATVSPALRLDAPLAALDAGGTFSEGAAGAWTMQGAVAGSLFTPPAGPLRGELGATVGGSAHRDGTRTGLMLGRARLHVAGATRGLWVGGGGGRTWDEAAGWHRTAVGDIGAWAALGRVTLSVAAAPTAVDTAPGAGVRYTDAEAAVRWAGGRAELAGSLGGRASGGPGTTGWGPATWGSAAATWWMAPRVAVVAAAGAYPVDYAQGFPGGRFGSVALRFAVGGAAPPRPAAPASPTDAPEAAPVAPAFGVHDAGRDSATGMTRRALRVRADGASRVELMGDVTDWAPVLLRRTADGWWEVTLPARAGAHQLNVRLDGGRWLVPPGLTALPDDFGGAVGLLVLQ